MQEKLSGQKTTFRASNAMASILLSQFQQCIFFPIKYKGGLILSLLSLISFLQVERQAEGPGNDDQKPVKKLER